MAKFANSVDLGRVYINLPSTDTLEIAVQYKCLYNNYFAECGVLSACALSKNKDKPLNQTLYYT